MSETKHTPGPWTVDGPPENQIVWSAAENRVCFLAHSSGLDTKRDIATGRLIAAAPNLLAALVAAKQALWLEARSRWTMADFKNWAVVQQIDAALELADGKLRAALSRASSGE